MGAETVPMYKEYINELTYFFIHYIATIDNNTIWVV